MFSMTLSFPDQRETCCYTWHGTQAVTLTCNAPSLRHKAPGSLSQGVEPSGVFSPGSAQSSSRSLGRCLLLGQRSRMNFFSHARRVVCFINTAEIRTHSLRATATMATLGPMLPRMFLWQTERKNSRKLPILADRRPRRLNEFTSKPAVSRAGDRSSIDPISRWSSRSAPNPESSELSKLLISRQSPIRARSWLATIQPIPGMLIRYSMHWDSSASSLQKRRISLVLLRPASHKTPNCRATDRV